MGNRDPFLTHLKKFGYSVVRLPRATVEPLQLVVKNGNRYRSIGKLTTVFSPGPSVPVPTITTNIPAANVNGHKSGNLKIGVGLNLLGHIISAMGGGTLGLQVAYQRARFTEFKFDDVLRDDAEVAKLDQFLSDADINPFSTGIDQMLEADRVCVTTSTLKSTKFTVISKESREKGLDLQVPVIKAVVGGSVGISADSESSHTITYEGNAPLVFGFQGVRLFYEDGLYTALAPDKPGAAGLETVMPGTTEGEPEYLVTESPFIGLRLD